VRRRYLGVKLDQTSHAIIERMRKAGLCETSSSCVRLAIRYFYYSVMSEAQDVKKAVEKVASEAKEVEVHG